MLNVYTHRSERVRKKDSTGFGNMDVCNNLSKSNFNGIMWANGVGFSENRIEKLEKVSLCQGVVGKTSFEVYFYLLKF